jgi:hypothetical protein
VSAAGSLSLSLTGRPLSQGYLQRLLEAQSELSLQQPQQQQQHNGTSSPLPAADGMEVDQAPHQQQQQQQQQQATGLADAKPAEAGASIVQQHQLFLQQLAAIC